MATKRSPILGYNHNFRHRGRQFHVQTEDSGVDNPHIFTHLFNGGVILNSRKVEYDRASAEEVVKGLMQSQHKAMLRDLKRGVYDDKIVEYLGPHPVEEEVIPLEQRLERLEPPPVSVQFNPSPQRIDAAVSEPVEIHQARPESEVGYVHSTAPPSAPVPPGSSTYVQRGVRKETPLMNTGEMKALADEADAGERKRPRVSEPPPIPSAARRPARSTQRPPTRDVPQPQPAAPSRPNRYPTHPRGVSNSSGVVVSRPAVIVGAPPKVVGGDARAAAAGRRKRPTAAPTSTAPPPQSRPARRARAAREEAPSDSLFGGDLISEKSLDEVILAYLSEDAEE